MDNHYNQQAARAVLGFLYEQDLYALAEQLCKESPYLEAERILVERGDIPINFLRHSLQDIIKDYAAMQSQLFQIVHRFAAVVPFPPSEPLLDQVNYLINFLKSAGTAQALNALISTLSAGNPVRGHTNTVPHQSANVAEQDILLSSSDESMVDVLAPEIGMTVTHVQSDHQLPPDVVPMRVIVNVAHEQSECWISNQATLGTVGVSDNQINQESDLPTVSSSTEPVAIEHVNPEQSTVAASSELLIVATKIPPVQQACENGPDRSGALVSVERVEKLTGLGSVRSNATPLDHPILPGSSSSRSISSRKHSHIRFLDFDTPAKQSSPAYSLVSENGTPSLTSTDAVEVRTEPGKAAPAEANSPAPETNSHSVELDSRVAIESNEKPHEGPLKPDKPPEAGSVTKKDEALPPIVNITQETTHKKDNPTPKMLEPTPDKSGAVPGQADTGTSKKPNSHSKRLLSPKTVSKRSVAKKRPVETVTGMVKDDEVEKDPAMNGERVNPPHPPTHNLQPSLRSATSCTDLDTNDANDEDVSQTMVRDCPSRLQATSPSRTSCLFPTTSRSSSPIDPLIMYPMTPRFLTRPLQWLALTSPLLSGTNETLSTSVKLGSHCKPSEINTPGYPITPGSSSSPISSDHCSYYRPNDDTVVEDGPGNTAITSDQLQFALAGSSREIAIRYRQRERRVGTGVILAPDDREALLASRIEIVSGERVYCIGTSNTFELFEQM